MKPEPTVEQVRAHVRATMEAIRALVELIVATGGMPNGHLYARVMGHCSFETYSTLLDLTKQAGLVTERNYWLAPTQRAIDIYGPRSQAAKQPQPPTV